MGVRPGSGSANAAAAAAALALMGGCGPKPTPIAHADGPQRRSGLWEERITQNGDAAHARLMRLCLDGANGARLSMFGEDAGKDCRSTAIRRTDGGYDFTTVCQRAGGALTTRGVAGGDFATGYHVRSTVTLSGLPFRALNGRRDVDVDARWLGPCPSGVSPGEALIGENRKLKVTTHLRTLAGALGA